LAPHLPRELVRSTEKVQTQEEVDSRLRALKIPLRDNQSEVRALEPDLLTLP
jgi:hypothetical protein